MKATELMIGDWCKMKLSSGTTWFTDKVGCINPDNGMEYEPIPLTTKILEENGWEIVNLPALKGNPIAKIKLMRGEVEYDIQYRIRHFFQVTGYYYQKEITSPYEVPYFFAPTTILIQRNWGVHELQHALRLCGFDELADNFKVWEEKK